MRRKKQRLDDDECLAILDAATSGVLSVLGDDGYPYGVPLSFVRVGSTLVFHSAATGHKIDAVKAHPKASFTVVAQDIVVPSEYNTHFRSVIAFGQVRIVEDRDEKLTLLRALGDHYWPGHDDELEAEIAPRFDRMHVLAFDIEHLTGKQSLALMGQEGEAASPEAGSNQGAMDLQLEKLPYELSICKVGDICDIHLDRDFFFVGNTRDELSLVCPTQDAPARTTAREDDWRGFRIQGQLDFSLVGILSKISGILAENGIGIFAISTYDTDYILVKAENFDAAARALASAGYAVVQ